MKKIGTDLNFAIPFLLTWINVLSGKFCLSFKTFHGVYHSILLFTSNKSPAAITNKFASFRSFTVCRIRYQKAAKSPTVRRQYPQQAL